jgi:16S rRNA (guanine527-N7)-methyltransferase
MNTARIAALLGPFLAEPLSARDLELISIYIDLLLRWNARINLTAIRNPAQIVTRHFGESFFLARHLFPTRVARTLLSAQTAGVSQDEGAPPIAQVAMRGPRSGTAPIQVLDLGSGAGFPALPIKIWLPAICLTLIESHHKKAAFLREATRSLRLTDVNVIAERVERLVSTSPPQADLVTLRAVEHFDQILPMAVQFMAPSARLALLIGSSQLPLLTSLTPTMEWQPPVNIPQSQSRVLSIGVHRAEVE